MIAVDWGTSSLRIYRLDESGAIRARREAPAGIMSVTGGAFAATLEAELGDWIGDGPIVMSGMIGSRQGWREVPYAECPAGAAEIARLMQPIEWGDGRRAWIAPGLCCRDESGVPDVMRGEETQIIGALADLPIGEATICLPGTHSKWVRWRDGRIADFATAMTGEVFAVLRRHSILGRLMSADDDAHDPVAFAAGLRRAREPGGLLHQLFAVRTRGLFGEIAADAQPSYLSGILIGHEIAALAPPEIRDGDGLIHLIGAPGLVALYREALAAGGRDSRILDSDCVARGLFLLAAHLPPEESRCPN
jgi:2-dehydro-3-deoxygalactonokinase